MIRKVMIGGALGALILFIWSIFSWNVLSWHSIFINQFKDEAMVSRVIRDNVQEDGVYIFPSFQKEIEGSHPTAHEEKVPDETPFICAVISLKGVNFFSPLPYLLSFLIHFTGAALMSYILLQLSDHYGRRLLSVTIVGLIIGVVVYLPGWNWFGKGHDHRFTLIMMADYFISWFLMGLALAACVKPSKKVNQRACLN